MDAATLAVYKYILSVITDGDLCIGSVNESNGVFSSSDSRFVYFHAVVQPRLEGKYVLCFIPSVGNVMTKRKNKKKCKIE